MTVQQIISNPLINWRFLTTVAGISVFLIVIASDSFLAFHTLIELFTIIVSFTMFTFAWSTKTVVKKDFLLFLACGYFWVGSLDLMHLLVYKGMNLFMEGSGNLSVQFWIVARYLEALLLLAAPFAVQVRQNGHLLFGAFGVLTIGLSVMIFQGNFPTTFIEEQGITDFKLYSEYLIIAILAAALAILNYVGQSISKREKILISFSIVLTICSEFVLTFYVDLYGTAVLLGHFFKFFSFWLIFDAVIVANIKDPYYALQKSKNSYKQLFENSEISIWNEDFSKVIEKHHKLREQGVTDLGQYLKKNEHIAWELAAMVKVNSVNDATLKLFAAKNKKEFYGRITETFGEDAIDVFIKTQLAVWEKKPAFRSEATYRTLAGKEINCIISFPIPQTRDGFKNVPVSLIDITQRKRDEQRIWRQANFDDLTGLVNRNLFFDRLSHALEYAKRCSTRVALLFIDLDGFKLINDTLGHLEGDKLLQKAAQRLARHMRKSDTVARLGGDEFAILLPENGSPLDIEAIVNKILRNLAEPYCLQGQEQNSFVSASIGVTIFPDDGDSAVTLLRKADSAMYRAKANGRNNFHFFSEEIDVEAMRRRELETALHLALTNNEFVINYQPVIDLKTGLIDSAEALIRWHNPKEGVVSPSEFIPLAEEIGLIVPIGEWILREACQEAMSWSAIASQPLGVAVNLSSRQFQRQNIPELVRLVLLETGLPAYRLTLEITESLLLVDNDTILDQLHEIRNLGVQLSIDDFGTGYSSLSYLKKFPVNMLKIDHTFIMNLPDSSEDSALVKAILSMADSLSLNVVAEGVETASQEEFLKSADCHYVQGYLYSRPLAGAEFTDYLKKQAKDEAVARSARHIA